MASIAPRRPGPIQWARMRIAVVALGKMGLPVAVWYAARGHDVTGCDINATLVAAINRGECLLPYEPGLAERLRAAVAGGR
ncbi:MAG: hypothetical protein C4290_14065, partial [Chloroflexota bacterium]